LRQSHTFVFTAAVAAAVAAVACQTSPRPAALPEVTELQSAESCAVVLARAEGSGNRLADREPTAVRAPLPRYAVPEANDFVVAFLVDTAGRVDSATVRVSPNAGAHYQSAVRELAPAWRYRPAVYRGCHVPYLRVDTIGIRVGSG
jgi:hypothetical protein